MITLSYFEAGAWLLGALLMGGFVGVFGRDEWTRREWRKHVIVTEVE